MPAIPLPFIIALLLAILLVKLVLLHETALRPAIGFVAACVVVALAVGVRWSFDAPFARFLQPVVAAALPPIAWFCFTAGRAARSKARWLHGLPGVVFDPAAKGSQAFVEFAQEMVERVQSMPAAASSMVRMASGA